jgi:hypothetical protein
MSPLAALASRPQPFPLPPPGPLDGPAEPNNDTESALVGSWVADATWNGTAGYYHLQLFKHAQGTFQDKSGSYLGENQWDWDAQPGQEDGFVLYLGGKAWQCRWTDGHDEFQMTKADGGVMTFYRNPEPRR